MKHIKNMHLLLFIMFEVIMEPIRDSTIPVKRKLYKSHKFPVVYKGKKVSVSYQVYVMEHLVFCSLLWFVNLV